MNPTVKEFELLDASKGKKRWPAFELIKFQFESNHGDTEKTCVYRVRVMGRD